MLTACDMAEAARRFLTPMEGLYVLFIRAGTKVVLPHGSAVKLLVTGSVMKGITDVILQGNSHRSAASRPLPFFWMIVFDIPRYVA